MERIIPCQRSVIVAADVLTLTDLSELAAALKDLPGIGGFKLGFTTGLQDLQRAVKIVRTHLGWELPIIYDHQKAGTDIPETGAGFAEVLKAAGVNAAILFPFAGPVTQEVWTRDCLDAGLQVITGGIMTHKQFLVSEGGYIADEAVRRIYRNACYFGCRHFVVPGTKLEWVKGIRSLLTAELHGEDFVLYAPGFITQGGDISECGKAAGEEWHAIVGRNIYEKPTRAARREAAIAVTSQIARTPA